ncbi:MAG: AzlD domain-containing protein [Rhizobiaceae bacterium]
MSGVTVWTILAAAVMTYLTRIGGHMMLSRFQRIHPRVEAALDAVPAAVLTTIIAPAAYHGGPAELAALAIAGIVAWRGVGMFGVFVAGGAVLIALRNLAGL